MAAEDNDERSAAAVSLNAFSATSVFQRQDPGPGSGFVEND